MRKCILFAMLITSGFFACSKKNTTNPEPVTIADLLPKNNEISGWIQSGDSWTATSSGELNTYINGAEPMYTRNGFVEGTMQQYEGSILGVGATVEVSIFDQSTGGNAKNLFDELVVLLVNPIDWIGGVGEEVKIERLQLAQKIVFRKSKYLVTLIISSGLDEALEVLKTFANNVDTKMS